MADPASHIPNGRVYVIEHVASGKRYVGFTTQSIRGRWASHKHDAINGRGGCRHLHNAIRKHGAEAFSIRQVFEGPRDAALACEARLIQEYRLLDRECGYNLRPGGKAQSHSQESLDRIAAKRAAKSPTETAAINAKISATLTGRPRSKEAIEKQRAKMIGRKHTLESRSKMSVAMKGRKFTDEWKAKISASAKNRPPVSEETRAKLRAANKRRTYKPVSAETKAKISATLMGRKTGPQSAEHLANRSAALRGRKLSPEHVQKIRDRKISPETRAKMRASAKLRWAKAKS